MTRIYFDNAATTALDPDVLTAMLPYLQNHYGNPSSIYSYGRETRMAIELARKQVAKLIGAVPAEIFFTSGGTESSNTAITAAVRDLGCTHIISSAIEHHATLHTIHHLQATQNVLVSNVHILENGHLDIEHLETLLQKNISKTLVTLMHANNEIGNLLPLQQVSELCKQYGAYLHTDMVQTIGHYPINLSKYHIHFASAAAHKFHGPKGVGVLYIKGGVAIKPCIHGGGQERNMRAGTENVYGIVGFAKALEIACANYEEEAPKIKAIKTYCLQQLQQHYPQLFYNGDYAGNSLYTVLNVAFPKNEASDMMLMNLDINHLCASGGSACSSGADAGSHVINMLGNTNQQPIRFSFSKYNTTAEVDALIAILKPLLA